MNKAKTRRGKGPTTIDEYLASVPPEARKSLTKIRAAIRSAVPKATEHISYGMPMFRYHRMLVAFAAFASHCSFFPMSRAVMETFKKELQSYDKSVGTIRFPVDKPLPATLVRKIVRARMAEVEARIPRTKKNE